MHTSDFIMLLPKVSVKPEEGQSMLLSDKPLYLNCSKDLSVKKIYLGPRKPVGLIEREEERMNQNVLLS